MVLSLFFRLWVSSGRCLNRAILQLPALMRDIALAIQALLNHNFFGLSVCQDLIELACMTNGLVVAHGMVGLDG